MHSSAFKVSHLRGPFFQASTGAWTSTLCSDAHQCWKKNGPYTSALGPLQLPLQQRGCFIVSLTHWNQFKWTETFVSWIVPLKSSGFVSVPWWWKGKGKCYPMQALQPQETNEAEKLLFLRLVHYPENKGREKAAWNAMCSTGEVENKGIFVLPGVRRAMPRHTRRVGDHKAQGHGACLPPPTAAWRA